VNSRLKNLIRRSPVLFHLAKASQGALVGLRRAAWRASRQATFQRYLEAHPVRRLQLGCGEEPTRGWLNTDLAPRAPGVLFLDVTEPFPFPDASFTSVFSEHLIEHVPFDAGRHLLAEAFRVLQPGGVLRIATPDLGALAALFHGPLNPTQQDYLRWIATRFLGDPSRATPTHVLNHNVRAWGHVFLYDEPMLRGTLEAAGFQDIVRRRVGQSDDPALAGLERHGKIVADEGMVAFETMVFEAHKPALGATAAHEVRAAG
jgi:predicted SAM-dependent methyltransferase